MYQRNGRMDANERMERGRDVPLLLPVPEAAHLLGIGTTLCWEMIHNGQLPTVRLGRRVLVPRAAIEQVASVYGTTGPGQATGDGYRPPHVPQTDDHE